MDTNLGNFNEGNNNPRKRRTRKQTPETQSQSFKELNESGKRHTQNQRVVDLLFFQKTPLSRRQIAEMAGIEISAMCRIIDDLLSSTSSPVVCAEQSRCPITKRPVYKYLHIRHYPELKAKSESK